MQRLGLDLDGVLYSWHRAVYTELTIYENLSQDFDSFWRSGYKSYKNGLYWENLIRAPHLYSSQVPCKTTLDLVKYLSSKYSLYYITNRPAEVFNTTVSWLTKYKFPNIKNLTFTADKVATCYELGVSIMVEDRTDNILSLHNSGIRVIAIRQPHNEEDKKQLCDLGILYLNTILELRGIL